MEDNHQCESLALAEVWIEKGEQGWQLNINKTATEQDLEENHYLETVGQTIYQVSVNVSFCPYCGSKFGGSDDSCIPSVELYDFSGGS
jgi:hypothetical protein